MCTPNVTIAVPEDLKREMKKRKKTNWSPVARRAFEEVLRQEEMSKAADEIDRLRTSSRTLYEIATLAVGGADER